MEERCWELAKDDSMAEFQTIYIFSVQSEIFEQIATLFEEEFHRNHISTLLLTNTELVCYTKARTQTTAIIICE